MRWREYLFERFNDESCYIISKEETWQWDYSEENQTLYYYWYSGKEAEHGTFIVNYTGRMDWGEVADYVESYAAIVDGHLLLEVTSMADKIFVTFMQLIKKNVYVDAFCKVMDELDIKYKLEGPYPNIRPKVKLPK